MVGVVVVGGWLEEGSTHHAQVLPLGWLAGSDSCWNVFYDGSDESGRSHLIARGSGGKSVGLCLVRGRLWW